MVHESVERNYPVPALCTLSGRASLAVETVEVVPVKQWGVVWAHNHEGCGRMRVMGFETIEVRVLSLILPEQYIGRLHQPVVRDLLPFRSWSLTL